MHKRMRCKADGEAKYRSNLIGCEDSGKTSNAADRLLGAPSHKVLNIRRCNRQPAVPKPPSALRSDKNVVFETDTAEMAVLLLKPGIINAPLVEGIALKLSNERRVPPRPHASGHRHSRHSPRRSPPYREHQVPYCAPDREA